MSSHSRVRVYLACSLDGYIAGPDDDLSWLNPRDERPPPPSDALSFEAFMAEVGAMLMGRRTYEVVLGLGAWMYGEVPVLVATGRPLEPSRSTVRAVSGDIAAMVAEAQAAAGDQDVYLDGGGLIRQALDADLVDELVITYIPVLLAGGVKLFDGLVERRWLEFTAHHRLGHDMLQVTARVPR